MADRRRDQTIYAERQKLLDVNTATVAELASIPGIDKARARDIVQLRERRGPFRDLEELRVLPGWEGETFEEVRAHLAVQRRLRG